MKLLLKILFAFSIVSPQLSADSKYVSRLGADLIQPVEDFTYSPFFPDKWEKVGLPTEMTVWPGKHIAFLTLDSNHDPAVITRLVRRLDKGWSIYQDLIGEDPKEFKNYKGLPTLAAIPEGLSCGAGCGFVGAEGIELCLFYSRDYKQLEENPESCPHYIFYEMGRNFFVFGDRFSYFATGFAVFMRYVCMDGTESEDLGLSERKSIEAMEEKLGSDKNPLTFLEMFTSVGDQARRENARAAGLSDSQNTLHAAVMLYLRKTQGGDAWVKRFYGALPTADSYRVGAENAPYQQCLNWLVCASIASQKNLAPLFMKRYKMPLSKDDQALLAKVNWRRKNLKIAKIVSKLSEVAPES